VRDKVPDTPRFRKDLKALDRQRSQFESEATPVGATEKIIYIIEIPSRNTYACQAAVIDFVDEGREQLLFEIFYVICFTNQIISMTGLSSTATHGPSPTLSTFMLMIDNNEGRAHFDDFLTSEQATALSDATREGLTDTLWAFRLKATDHAAIDKACESATRIANRCFNTGNAPSGQRCTQRGAAGGHRASPADDNAPPTKRPCDEGARASTTDENINPDRVTEVQTSNAVTRIS
jgi:hypothetical protein